MKGQIYIIKTLLHFQYVDDLGRDHGSCVRQKTKDLLALLENPEMIATRRNNPQMQDPRSFLEFNEEKYGRSAGEGNSSPRQGWSAASSSRAMPPASDSNAYSISREEERQLQMALDASRQQMVLDAQRRASIRTGEDDDIELQAALRISATEASSASSRKSNEDLIDLFQGPPPTSEIHRELSTLNVGMPPPPLPSQHYYSAQYAYQVPFPSQPHQELHQSSCEVWNQPPSHCYQELPNYHPYPMEENSTSPSAIQPGYHHNEHTNGTNISAMDDPFAGLSSELHQS